MVTVAAVVVFSVKEEETMRAWLGVDVGSIDVGCYLYPHRTRSWPLGLGFQIKKHQLLNTRRCHAFSK
jgi:hypothetical protein